jgi:hypothetical protein
MYVLHIHSEAINTLAEASMTKADDRVSKELLTVLSGEDADEIERTVNRLMYGEFSDAYYADEREVFTVLHYYFTQFTRQDPADLIYSRQLI